jgi:2,3-bisphosphoglycerate-dependent phosphoglycerate mutase
MKDTLYLVRHATPDWTRTDLSYYLPPGPPLTPKGRAEAEALGAFLLEAGAGQVFTSPLERCLRTAQIAADEMKAPLEVISSLVEWQPGENQAAVVKRLRPVMEMALRAGRRGSPSVVVTHGGPIAVLLEECGMDAATLEGHRVYDNNNPLPPAGVWRARRKHEHDPWQLQLIFKPGSNHQSTE